MLLLLSLSLSLSPLSLSLRVPVKVWLRTEATAVCSQACSVAAVGGGFVLAWNLFVFPRWKLGRAHYFHSLVQDQSTVAQRAGTTGPSVPWQVACELVSWQVPTLCLHNSIISPLWLRWVKGVYTPACIQTCNLLITSPVLCQQAIPVPLCVCMCKVIWMWINLPNHIIALLLCMLLTPSWGLHWSCLWAVLLSTSFVVLACEDITHCVHLKLGACIILCEVFMRHV